MPKTKHRRGAFEAVFNSHVNDAHDRALEELEDQFPIWHEEIVKRYDDGIMLIFDHAPTPAIAAYVALVTYFVNQGKG